MATISSAASATTTVTPEPTSWWLKAPTDPDLNTAIRAVDFEPTQARPSAVFAPPGRDRHVVLHGTPRGVTGTLQLRTHELDEYEAIEALLAHDDTLLLQNVIGQQWYVEVTGDVTPRFVRAERRPAEPYPVRHFHVWSIPLTEVDPP